MRIVSTVLTAVVCFSVFSTCKNPDITESPAKIASNKEPAGPVVLVTGHEEVSLEETPRLTVKLDVKDCLYEKDKWPDAESLESRAISVAPRIKGEVDSTQPDARIFEPDIPVDSTDSTAKATVEYSWRLKRGSYSIDVLAYQIKGPVTESKISKDFDFSQTNDLVLTVEGVWTTEDDNKFCKLEWK
jgi:hypothetical protein